MALEQRILLDAAGFSTAVDLAVDAPASLVVPAAAQRKNVDSLLSALGSEDFESPNNPQILTLVIADAVLSDIEGIVGAEFSGCLVRHFDSQTEGLDKLTDIIEAVPSPIRSVHILFPAHVESKLRLPWREFPPSAPISGEEEEIDGVCHWRIGGSGDCSPNSGHSGDVLEVSGNLISEVLTNAGSAGHSKLSIGSLSAGEGDRQATISGLFGDLYIDLLSGEYCYRLNTVSPLVQVLEGDEAPVENFSYSLTNPQGSSVTALLVLTVNNKTPAAANDEMRSTFTISRRLNGSVVVLERNEEAGSSVQGSTSNISGSVLSNKGAFGGIVIQNSLQSLLAENQFLPLVYTLLHELKEGAASTFLVSLSIADPITSRALISDTASPRFELVSDVKSGELVFKEDGSFSFTPYESSSSSRKESVCQENFSCKLLGSAKDVQFSVSISIVANQSAENGSWQCDSEGEGIKAPKVPASSANVEGVLRPVNSVVHIVANGGRSLAVTSLRKTPGADGSKSPGVQKIPTKHPRMTITLVDQVIESQEDSVFSLEEEVFGFVAGSLEHIEARGVRSTQLPDFIHFDSQTLRFEVDVKSALRRAWNCIPLSVVATSTTGEVTSGDFTIIISEQAQESALKGLKLDFDALPYTAWPAPQGRPAAQKNAAMNDLEAYRQSMKQADVDHGNRKSANEKEQPSTKGVVATDKESKKKLVKLLKDLVGMS